MSKKPTYEELEEELSRTRNQMDQLLSSSPAIIYSCKIDDKRLIPTFTSTNVTGQLGYDMTECLEDPSWWFNNIHPDDREKVLLEMNRVVFESSRDSFAHEYRFRQKKGPYIWVHDEFNIFRDESGKARKIVGSWLDISRRKKMEEEMIKSQKLESIGVLAGGIAHDFNNFLTVILNGIVYLEETCDGDEVSRTVLEDMKNVVEKATSVSSELLTFSRGGAPVKEVTSIATLIEKNIELFLSGSNVKADIAIDTELWSAEADAGKIVQALSNTVLNAVHAMPDGGTLKVKASNKIINDSSDLPLARGKYIRISILDHGSGIENEDQTRIFDPYYTTKSKALGMGLTTAYSIIKHHEGLIEVNSEAGKGTEVIIYLPAYDVEIPLEKVGAEFAMSEGLKLLFMDDETRLREIVSKLLRLSGYKVAEAADGSEAIKQFEEAMNSGEPFDAVVLDLTIPGGMGGKETIEKLLELDSSVKAIVASGYSNDPVLANFRAYGFSGSLQKPYMVEDLIDKLNEILA